VSNYGQQGGSRYGDLMGLWTVRSAENESQISERWNDIIASRFKVRMYQWLGAIASTAGILFASILLGTPIALTVGQSKIEGVLLIGAIIGIAAVVASGGVGYLFRNSRSQGVVAVISTGLTSFVVLAIVLGTIAISDDMDWWRSILAILGACLFTPSLAVTFFFLSDLVDPMGWISGFERMMRPELKRWFAAQYSNTQETPIIPWNHANRKERISSRDKTRGDETVERIPHHLDIELADFLGEALIRGLSRDAGWIGAGVNKFVLPTTGATVRRNKYDQLIALAEKHEYVRKAQGKGKGHEWIMEPQKAYDDWCSQIEEEWGDYLEVR
jgi:ABC-type multidrug transport system fused ATPase/permease subunit